LQFHQTILRRELRLAQVEGVHGVGDGAVGGAQRTAQRDQGPAEENGPDERLEFEKLKIIAQSFSNKKKLF
jgi:hypothetical protein